MSNIKVGAAALNQTPLDWNRNKENIIKALQQAKQEKVQILCLPEMVITGYGCEDHFLSEEVRTTAWKILQELLPHTKGIFTCFGIPYLWCNALYNVMVAVYNGNIIGIVPKQHLAGDGLHYEPRWFKPWPAGLVKEFGTSYDIGDLIFNIKGVKIGFEICEDAFVAQRPGGVLASRGVNIILNPSASHFAFGKQATRERLVIEGSRAFNATYIYANLLGNEAGRAIYDGDCLIATCGDLIARGPCLSMKRVVLTTAVIDLSKSTTKAIGTASFSPNLEDFDTIGVVNEFASFSFSPSRVSKPITSNYLNKFDEFTKAISLGLLDYLEKSHSKGFVISLSGGADSAACAILISQMVLKALDELGLNQIGERLGIDVGCCCCGPEPINKTLIGKLLTCVYQATENSSDTTFKAAEAVANEIGAKFCSINIDSLVKQYIALAEQVEGRKLTWEQDDIALQNIQARTRAPSIWMIANLEGKLLITTSNRSEAAVGYCTMDGDTAGSLAPIGGIDKAFILEWLVYMVHSYVSLAYIICQKPTAELRPGQSQTDEDDLMPYKILNDIEIWAIVEKKGPQEVLDCLRREYSVEYDVGVKYVNKFFSLWARNQWKRIKFSASPHCDDHSLDPETWCRFPILSGGFSEELAALK